MVHFHSIINNKNNILIIVIGMLLLYIGLICVAIHKMFSDQNFILPIICFTLFPLLYIIFKKLSIIYNLHKAKELINSIQK